MDDRQNMPPSSNRDRWDKKYREASPSTWATPDPFLPWAFSKYISSRFPRAGTALDFAGGAGRHAIWLAKQGWEVTLIDISETGVEQARQKAGNHQPNIHFVVDDLTHFGASQIQFDLIVVFSYLDRNIFPEVIKALRPGGLLIYKTLMHGAAGRAPNDACGRQATNSFKPQYLLCPGELPQLVSGLHVLHYREISGGKKVAELVAQKAPHSQSEALHE
jgi:tellurite methyltransferase